MSNSISNGKQFLFSDAVLMWLRRFPNIKRYTYEMMPHRVDQAVEFVRHLMAREDLARQRDNQLGAYYAHIDDEDDQFLNELISTPEEELSERQKMYLAKRNSSS